MTGTREALGLLLLLLGLTASIIALEVWTRRKSPPSEWTRKMIHVGGLLPCLIFPFLIHSVWIALIISLLASAGLYINERRGLLHCLSGVQRKTSGTAYYPAGVFMVYLLSGERYWMYVSALLALCLADALAALVGKSFARFPYGVGNEWKTIEGSLVFLFVTFAAVLFPMLLMTSIPWPVCFLAASLTALLVTGFEAVSLNGLDNLFVPVGVCIILDRIVYLPWPQLLAHNLLLLSLLAGVFLMTRLSRQMDSDAALVITIFTYTAIAFANWYWALAPLLGLAIFLAVRMQFPHPEKQRSRVRVHLTARVLLPLLLVLAFANTTEEAAVYQGAYLACAAVTLWFCLRVFLACRQVGPPRIRAAYAALAGAGTSLVLVLPPWILQEAAPGALAGIVGMCTLLAVFHEWTLPTGRLWTTEDFWTIPRTLLACCAIAGILLLQQFEIIPQWPDILTFPKQVQA